MELGDFLGAKNVIIQIHWGENVIEFPTEILQKYEDGVLVKPYLYEGKSLELSIDSRSGVVCNIFGDHPINKNRVSWRNLDLSTMEYDDDLVYFIKASGYNKVGNIDDRRTHPRDFVHIAGIVQDRENDKSTSIMIHDLSDNGISFYAPIKYNPTSNFLIIHFEDVVNNQVFHLKVECHVKRRMEKAGMAFFGCEISSQNHDLQIYSFMKHLLQSKKNEAVDEMNSAEKNNDETIDATDKDTSGETE